jgi:hypothetical protein
MSAPDSRSSGVRLCGPLHAVQAGDTDGQSPPSTMTARQQTVTMTAAEPKITTAIVAVLANTAWSSRRRASIACPRSVWGSSTITQDGYHFPGRAHLVVRAGPAFAYMREATRAEKPAKSL